MRYVQSGGRMATAPKYHLHNVLYRDYYMAIFISYPISTRDTHIIPRAEDKKKKRITHVTH